MENSDFSYEKLREDLRFEISTTSPGCFIHKAQDSLLSSKFVRRIKGSKRYIANSQIFEKQQILGPVYTTARGKVNRLSACTRERQIGQF